MRAVWVLIVLLVHSSAGNYDNKLLRVFQNAIDEFSISPTCNASMALYFDNIMSNGSDQWALRMFDATSKIPVGLLFSFNFGEVGDFTQCLKTESEDGSIKAKYCLVHFDLAALFPESSTTDLESYQRQVHLRKSVLGMAVTPRENEASSSPYGMPPWAICLPSSCSNDDVAEILSQVIPVQSMVCQTAEDLHRPLTNKAIAALTVLGVIAFTMVTSTAYDLYCHVNKCVPSSQVPIAFSVYTNGGKLFKINKNSSELSCLNGLRVLSMVWVVIGHTHSITATSPIFNMIDATIWADSLRSMAIVNGTLSVDTFFVVGGCLLAYVFIKTRKNGVKFNIFQFYLHRYLRLTPALAAVVLVSATLLEYMGSGPNWNDVIWGFQSSCEKYWWSALLYIQNFVNCSKLCVGQTWYLNIDFQLYLISPLILYPLLKYPKIGLGIVVACIVTFIIVPFYVAYERELSGVLTSFVLKASVDDYMLHYYYQTYTRAAPWFIGVLVGYLVAKVKLQNSADYKLKINKMLLTVLWVVCFIGLTACVFGGHSTLRGPEYDRIGNAFYIALVRPVWSICVAWIIFACVTGYGGPINWVLSLPIYQVLNRFTYSLYLLHVTIMYMISGAAKRGIYFSSFSLAYSFWGLYMISTALSIVWVLAFESPVIIFEKLLFKGMNKLTGRRQNHNKPPMP